MNTSKKIISLLMCMLMVLTMVPMSVFAAEATEIDTVHIEGIPAPLYGQTVGEYNDVMRDGSMNGTHKINGSTRVNVAEDIFYGNIELSDWEYYNSEKSYIAPSSADNLPSVYYLVHWLYPAAGYKFPDDVAVTVDGAMSIETELDEDGCLAVWAKFEVAPPTKIDTVHIEGIPAPLYGQTSKDYLDDVIAKVKVNNEPYDSKNQTFGNLNVEWQAIYDSTKTGLSSSEILTAGTYYYLLNLYPKTGFVFADIDDISASVNGNASVELESSTEYDDTVLVWVKLEVAAPTEIDTIHIEGLPAPLYGQTGDEYVMASIDKHKNGELKVNGNIGSAWMFGNVLMEDVDLYDGNKNNFTGKTTTGTYYAKLYLSADDGYMFPADVAVTVDGAVSVEKAFDGYGSLIVYAKFEVKTTEITSVELTVSGYQCGGFANQITFTGSEGTHMIPSTYPVFTDINDFEGTALYEYDGFCRDTEYWVSAAFAAADGYALPELSKNDITLKGFTVLDKYVSYDATEQTIWVAFKLSAHSFDDDSDNTCNLCNKDRYTYTEADGKATITAYNGPGGAVNIPSTIGGYPVTVIGEDAFCEKYDITSVSIPDSVTTIEEDAFYDNELTSVHIGKGVTSIGEDAFAFSAEFETITVDEDNDYYLSENNVLFDIDKEELIVYAVKKTDTSYTVPATVKKIHRAAFNFAKNLKSITISDGVTDIGSFAFSGCKNITSLIIPNSVTSIGSYAFGQMDNLKYVIISDKLTTVSSYAFQFCEKLTDVVIPASVTSIESGAFRYCSSLSDIYYTGTQAQWENVAVNNNSGYHDKFLSANVHYNAQVVDGHVYDNDCDAECNLCTEIRTAPHAYDNACDAECNICKAPRTPAAHTGGTATCTEKAKCTVCGEAYGNLAKHKEVTVAATPATYKETGLTEGKKCSVCGTVTVAQQTVAKLTLGKVDGLKAKKVKVAKKSEITLTWNSLGDGVKYEVYVKNGKKWTKLTTTSKTSYTVKKDGKKKSLKADKEYQFRVRAVVDDIKGKYSSTLKVETIPATATLKLKAGKKQLTASWSKISDISGYEVQYSTSKKFTKKTTKTVKVKKSSKKTTVKKLKKGKKYYVRIRTYKTVDGKKIYSDWSKVKSIKVK